MSNLLPALLILLLGVLNPLTLLAAPTGLTPLGAERAGNAEGTIPAWDGGLTTPPASYRVGQHESDPFPADKPLFQINAANAEQYSKNLSPGQKALLEKYPDSWHMKASVVGW